MKFSIWCFYSYKISLHTPITPFFISTIYSAYSPNSFLDTLFKIVAIREVHNIALLGINTNKCFKWSYSLQSEQNKRTNTNVLKGVNKRREHNIMFTNLSPHDLTHTGWRQNVRSSPLSYSLFEIKCNEYIWVLFHHI